MASIANGLPSWARVKVCAFLEKGDSPIDGVAPQPISEIDAQVHEAVLRDLVDKMVSSDQDDQDLDRRDGYIRREVLAGGLEEKIRYEREGRDVEVAYDFGDGHHAQYLLLTADRTVLVDLSQSTHSYDMAVLVDKTSPAKSVLYAKES